MMKKGATKTLYVRNSNMKLCENLSMLAEKNESSFSDIMNEAIQQAYYQKRTGVWISPGAYLAIANGELNVLECVRSREGGTDLVLKRTAPGLAGEGLDSTFPDMTIEAAYSIGEGRLKNTEEQ